MSTESSRTRFKDLHDRLKRNLPRNLDSNVTVEALSSKVPAFLLHGLISAKEADFIVSAYTPYLYTCGLRSYLSCTELQIDLSTEDHEVLASIEERFMSLLLPLAKAEAFLPKEEWQWLDEMMQWQLVRYTKGGGFNLHHDQTGVPMPVTIMAYLTDSGTNGEGLGGHTVFPDAGVRVVPRKGDVLLWSSCHQDGTLNDASEHMGEPVTDGFKFILNLFLTSQELDLK